MTYQAPYVAMAALSTVLSSTVVLTGLLWPKYMLSKNRPFSNVIFYISLCDFCASFLNCLGFPSDGIICNFQSFAYLFFFPASWLWTLMLVYQLRTLIIHKNIRLSINSMHVICWTIACIPALFPLTTNPYGQDDGLEGNTTCTLGGNPQTKFIWKTVSVSGLAFSCGVLMSFWCVEIVLFFSRTGTDTGDTSDSSGGDNDSASRTRQMSLFKSMRLYPIALFVTWSSYFIMDLLLAAGILNTKTISITAVFVVIAIGTQCGSLLTIIYFSQSSVARMLWADLLRRNLNLIWNFRYRKDETAGVTLMEATTSAVNIIARAREDDEDVLVVNALSLEDTTLRDSEVDVVIQLPEL